MTAARPWRRWFRVRIAILAIALLCAPILIARRAFNLQVEQGEDLGRMARAQYQKTLELAPKRGSVFDRNGAELAVSVEVESVWANPRAIRAAGLDPSHVAQQLSGLLPTRTETLTRRLSSNRYFVWLGRHVHPKNASSVRQLRLPGVHLIDEAKRFYPNRQLAAHLLGFADIDGKGIEGLELALEDLLRGPTRRVSAIRDRRGSVVYSEQLLDERMSRGNDVFLSLDRTIQHIAERELSNAIRTFEAKAGSVVVLDPRTGELLAIANNPEFNPNNPGSAPAGHRRNRAVTDRFEPGSTVKPFTIAAALAAGKVRPGDRIDCEEGAMQVAEYTIHDARRFESLTPAEILAQSSNIGTAKIGKALGRRNLYRAMRSFGFGDQTGIELPGETAGILRHFQSWYEMDAATISFGQGMSVTTLQLALAMGALANDGQLVHPILIKRVIGPTGRTVKVAEPRVRRQVVPAQTARLVADMLTGVTGPDGTAPEASIDGFLVAGKTGTAQKADARTGGYSADRWLSSFAGFVPSRNPRIVVAVVIDEPIIAHYGGTVAAPVFRRVANATLEHLGVLPEALASVRRGTQGGAGASQQPAPLPVKDDLGEVGRVPDLRGLAARAVIARLGQLGLTVELEGSGLVVSQTPEAGSLAEFAERVHVVLAPPKADAPKEEPSEEAVVAVLREAAP